MRPSVYSSVQRLVLCAWAVCLMVCVAYAWPRRWDDVSARADGVFLAHRLLEEEAPARREVALGALREDFDVGLEVVGLEEVESRFGESLAPGERVHIERLRRRSWHVVAFEVGDQALVAGPVNPLVPRGYLPIGLLLVFVSLPLLAWLIVLWFGRELAALAQANLELASGSLDVRVDDEMGPSAELAKSFNEMADQIEHLVKSRDELVQAVSHELGSPLGRLRLHMALLEVEFGDEHSGRLDGMSGELDALDELVAELLGYVQFDNRVDDVEAFAPVQMLTELTEIARLEAYGEKAIALDASSRDVRLRANPRLFARAIENLMRNAVSYAAEEVLLVVFEEEDHVCVSVHDDGPGIPEDLVDEVLKPFFRLEPDRTRKLGGVGLGLSIVSRIVASHGGVLTIGRSRLGGALVETRWPRA